MQRRTNFNNGHNLHVINNVLEDDIEDDDDYNEFDDIDLILNQPKIKYIKVIHSFIINSFDRDWINTSDTPYNFRIRFNPESEQRVTYPLYENNPTIPATTTQSRSGRRGDTNTAGWYDSISNFHMAYDATQPLGSEVDREDITFKEIQYAPIDISLKNIVSIKMVSAVLPNHKKTIEYTTSTEYLSDYQSINVLIDELEHTQEGTNTNLRKSFVMLYPKIKISNSIPPFTEYININGWESDININTLPIMTIKCYDPLNNLISNKLDVLDIEFIYRYQSDMDDTQTEVLIIKTTNYFDSNEYVAGNKIIIRNYVYRDASSSYAGLLNQFINRDEGHTILTIAKETGKYLYNFIHIPKPATMNTLTGEIDNLAWYTMLKLDGFTSDPETISDNEPGKILNLNMQTLFFFHISTMEPDTSIINGNQLV